MSGMCGIISMQGAGREGRGEGGKEEELGWRGSEVLAAGRRLGPQPLRPPEAL